MKQINKNTGKRASYIPDDDSVRYKLNTQYINTPKISPLKALKNIKPNGDDDNILYKFPPAPKIKSVQSKSKPKPKIKVNFWSNKQNVGRVSKTDNKINTDRRHTISGNINEIKPKSTVKVRKRVSFLPSPVFNDNHIPMVTVPDDLTIQLNEEEANDLGEDLNSAFVNNEVTKEVNDNTKRKVRSVAPQINTKSRRKQSFDDVDSRYQGNDNELEFFSKYVVQKLRRMETNQRIYSENLINTVLMLGQLGKLNVKSKISEA